MSTMITLWMNTTFKDKFGGLNERSLLIKLESSTSQDPQQHKFAYATKRRSARARSFRRTTIWAPREAKHFAVYDVKKTICGGSRRRNGWRRTGCTVQVSVLGCVLPYSYVALLLHPCFFEHCSKNVLRCEKTKNNSFSVLSCDCFFCPSFRSLPAPLTVNRCRDQQHNHVFWLFICIHSHYFKHRGEIWFENAKIRMISTHDLSKHVVWHNTHAKPFRQVSNSVPAGLIISSAMSTTFRTSRQY